MTSDASERDLRLADAMNTYNAALGAIRGKGFRVYLVPDAREDHLGTFWAIKDRRDFIASDPLRLLGLISMWEYWGDDWQTQGDANLYQEVVSTSLNTDTYATLDDQAFSELVEHFSMLFRSLGEPLPERVSRQRLAELVAALGQESENS